MRPTFETKEDREEQDCVRELIEKNWNVRLIDTPKHHVFDFVALRHVSVMGFIEFKRRKGNFGRYPDTMLSTKKLNGVNAFHPFPVFFVVQWDDKLVYCKLTPDLWLRSEWGGRTLQSRDDQDVEIVAKIENKHFKELA